MLTHDETSTENCARLVVENANKDGSSYVVQMVRQRLRCSLSGLNLDSGYKIIVSLCEETGNLSYATDATSTRSMMRLTAKILIRCEEKEVYEAKIPCVTSYSQNENDEFINQSAVQGAQERLIETLTIDISRDLQRFAKSRTNV